MAYVYAGGLSDTSFTAGSITLGYQSNNFTYGGHVTFGSAGTVTKLGIRILNYASGPAHVIKLALYDASGNLVSGSSGTFTLPEAGDGWYDCTETLSASVSAGTYYVMYSAAQANGCVYYSSSGNGTYATEAHATFPAATETLSIEAEPNALFAVRADFTAGGPSGPSITNVSDTTLDNGQTGIVITGTGFGASQGAGTVDIGDNADPGLVTEAVAQTVTSWSDTSITFTAVRGTLPAGSPLYLFVTNDDSATNATGEAIEFLPRQVFPPTRLRSQSSAVSGSGAVT